MYFFLISTEGQSRWGPSPYRHAGGGWERSLPARGNAFPRPRTVQGTPGVDRRPALALTHKSQARAVSRAGAQTAPVSPEGEGTEVSAKGHPRLPSSPSSLHSPSRTQGTCPQRSRGKHAKAGQSARPGPRAAGGQAPGSRETPGRRPTQKAGPRAASNFQSQAALTHTDGFLGVFHKLSSRRLVSCQFDVIIISQGCVFICLDVPSHSL